LLELLRLKCNPDQPELPMNSRVALAAAVRQQLAAAEAAANQELAALQVEKAAHAADDEAATAAATVDIGEGLGTISNDLVEQWQQQYDRQQQQQHLQQRLAALQQLLAINAPLEAAAQPPDQQLQQQQLPHLQQQRQQQQQQHRQQQQQRQQQTNDPAYNADIAGVAYYSAGRVGATRGGVASRLPAAEFNVTAGDAVMLLWRLAKPDTRWGVNSGWEL